MGKSDEKSEISDKIWTYKAAIVSFFIVAVTALFVYLNSIQTHFYIDEEFHVGQTLRYCRGKFFEWDNKITTLPGLYLITFPFLAPLGLCNIVCMRCVNLLATLANFYLVYSIVETIRNAEKKDPDNVLIRFGLVLSIVSFPPLFFWFFLYYTDVVSLNFVLLTWLMHLRGRFRTAAVAGFMAILVRQTNVIWVAVLSAERVVDLLEAQTPRSIEALVSRNIHNTPMHAKLIWNNIYHHVSRGSSSFYRFVIDLIDDLRYYGLVGLGFLIFVIVNGGIVVGDRNAHTATIHFPQIFYYNVFSMIFAWPYMLPQAREFLKFVTKKWLLTSIFVVVAATIVHCNTLVHPYLLADNRHYTFYIWNRFMGRYHVIRYLLVPIYGFAIYAHFSCLRNTRFLSQIIYALGVVLMTVPQLLLEPRYFIIPYVYLRLNMTVPSKWQIISELITTAVINFAQFYIFVNKTFYWTDGEYPQRISW